MVNIFWNDAFDISFNEIDSRVPQNLIIIVTNHWVVDHSLNELFIDEVLCFLPEEFVGAWLANLFSLIFQKVEQALNNSWAFHDLELFQSHKIILPGLFVDKQV